MHGLPWPCEIVVSDNASTDETIDVLRSFEADLPLRWSVQTHNVGAEANVVSALRQARGTYVVYLADDDQIELGRVTDIIGLFQASPSLVCVQAPWRSWDDREERDLGPFYRLSGPAVFGPDQAWPCWQYLLRHQVFPEIAIYRADALWPALHLPRTLHWAFVWCFRLLAQGQVAFDPEPFYRHVVRAKADLPGRSQLGVTQSTTHLDRYRGGLEWALAGALRGSIGHVPQEHRQQAAALLGAFIADRAAVAARVAAQQRDFISAVEHFTRSVTWQAGVNGPELQDFERQHTMLAGLQALAAAAQTSAGVTGIILAGVPNRDTVVALLREVFGYDGSIEATATPSCAEGAVVLVPSPADRRQWIEAGHPPGLVLAWEELADCYRVHNPLGAMAQRTATRGAA